VVHAHIGLECIAKYEKKLILDLIHVNTNYSTTVGHKGINAA